MSYILEALKKSEQSRGHGSTPGIQTVHSSSLNYRPAARSIWPWILIAAVLLNLVVLLYFVFHKTMTIPATAPTPAQVKQANNSTTTNIDHPIQQRITKPPQVTTQPVTKPTTPEPVPAPQAQVVENKVDHAEVNNSQAYSDSTNDIYQAVDISKLPENIRNQIPHMKFTAHVYSSDPRQRSVVINGRYMEEGESLDDGLVLKQITSNGVIMDFQGHLFSTNVISGW